MLKISKALSAGKLENYHKQEFTSPDQSYWSQGQTVQGEWQGQLAEKYGLAGAVNADEFHRLSEGQHPQTGEQLVQHRQSFEYQGRRRERQSNPSSIAPDGMRPSVRRSRFR